MSLICKLCAKTFSTRGTLSRHQKNVHNMKESNLISYSYEQFNNKCLEEGCNSSYRLTSDLRYHLEECHAQTIEKEILHFSSKEEFDTWFTDICKNSNLSYIRKEELDKNRVYFNCNRSGKIEVKVDNRKRALKSQGSCKMGINCVSQIILIKNSDNTYQATYYKSHYGHLIQVQHIPLPKQTRVEVASKLTSGVTATKILDMYRNNFVEDKLSRANLLTRKDINNIKSSFQINIDFFHLKLGENIKSLEQSSDIIVNQSCTKTSNELERSQCLVAERSNNTDVDLGKQKIRTELNELQLKIDICKDADLEPVLPHILKTLKNANTLLSLNNNKITDFNYGNQLSKAEPANKKIKKQTSFFSTKKKPNKISSTISKPSTSESCSISQTLSILSEHDYC